MCSSTVIRLYAHTESLSSNLKNLTSSNAVDNVNIDWHGCDVQQKSGYDTITTSATYVADSQLPDLAIPPFSIPAGRPDHSVQDFSDTELFFAFT